MGLVKLGHGNSLNKNVPKKIERLKNIQELSCGFSGDYFLAKDIQNKIYVTRHNASGQLGIGDVPNLVLFRLPKEMNPQYFHIWGEFSTLNRRAKSTRK